MSDHWTRIAAERIEAGEDEVACLADYGYVPADEIERLTAELGESEKTREALVKQSLLDSQEMNALTFQLDTMQERERLACVRVDELQAKLAAVTKKHDAIYEQLRLSCATQ